MELFFLFYSLCSLLWVCIRKGKILLSVILKKFILKGKEIASLRSAGLATKTQRHEEKYFAFCTNFLTKIAMLVFFFYYEIKIEKENIEQNMQLFFLFHSKCSLLFCVNLKAKIF